MGKIFFAVIFLSGADFKVMIILFQLKLKGDGRGMIFFEEEGREIIFFVFFYFFLGC